MTIINTGRKLKPLIFECVECKCTFEPTRSECEILHTYDRGNQLVTSCYSCKCPNCGIEVRVEKERNEFV